MHDRTRRMLCRIGFVAFCVIPTVGVFAWSNSQTTSGHSASLAAELSRELALRVSLTGVFHPRPGAALYEGLELADPETGRPLARMRFLEVGGGDSLATLVASQPEIDALHLDRLGRLVVERLRNAVAPQAMVRLAASDVTLDWPEGAQTLTDLVGQIDGRPGEDGQRTATINFRLAGNNAGEPIKIRYSRRLKESQPTARIEVNTGDAAVPCSLLAGPAGIANHLGQQACFHGSFWAVETAEGWEGQCAGELTAVDLQTAIGEQFPHHLTGQAKITMKSARFRHGRLEEARGTVIAEQGDVGQSLLTAAATNLHLAGSAATNSNASLVAYTRLALEFEIDSSGVTLHGAGREPGAIVESGDSVLLAESQTPTSPVVALLRTLVPQSEVQVPASRQSEWLIHRLPVPRIVPPADERPHGKIRLAPSQPAEPTGG